MTPADYDKLLVVITSVAEVFNEGLSDVKLKMYADALSDWPIEALQNAVKSILQNCRFFPRPAEWIDHAQAWLREQDGRRRAERLRTHALTEEAESQMGTPEERRALARRMIDDLTKQLGWRRGREA